MVAWLGNTEQHLPHHLPPPWPATCSRLLITCRSQTPNKLGRWSSYIKATYLDSFLTIGAFSLSLFFSFFNQPHKSDPDKVLSLHTDSQRWNGHLSSGFHLLLHLSDHQRHVVGGSVVTNPRANAGDPGDREDPLKEEMTTHTVFLSGKSHQQRRLVGYSPRGLKESDITEHPHTPIYYRGSGVAAQRCVPSPAKLVTPSKRTGWFSKHCAHLMITLPRAVKNTIHCYVFFRISASL